MRVQQLLALALASALTLTSGCAEAEVLLTQLLTETKPASASSAPKFRTGGTGVTVRDTEGHPIVRSGTSLRQADLQPIEETASLVEDENVPDSVDSPDSLAPVSSESGDHTVNAAPDIEVHVEAEETPPVVVEEEPSVSVSADYPWQDGFMPYRDMLSDADKTVYDEIYRNVSQMVGHFRLQSKATPRTISPIVRAVIYDNPDLFWLDSSYRFGYTSDGRVTEVEISFNTTVLDMETAKANFNAAAEQIIQGAQMFESDFDKEKYVHDYLLDLVQYDLTAPNNQSAYSALVGRASVCAGYAKAFQYIMMRLGIPCYYCVGYAGEDHAWNLVLLEGQFYNVDVAWDDPVGNPQGQYRYDYFNLTDREIAADHRRTEMSVYLPASA